jgi:hypothetical protein
MYSFKNMLQRSAKLRKTNTTCFHLYAQYRLKIILLMVIGRDCNCKGELFGEGNQGGGQREGDGW